MKTMTDTHVQQILAGKASASCKHTGYGTEIMRGTPGGITSKGYLLTAQTNSVNGVLLMLYLVLEMYRVNKMFVHLMVTVQKHTKIL
jgi:hypothetical protein